MKKEILIDMKKLNIYYIVIQLLSMVVLSLIDLKLKPFLIFRIRWYMVVYILFIFLIHEVLHGVGFKIIGKVPWKNIKIGFNKKFMAPFCTCKDLVMTKRQYIAVMLLPNVVLSLLTLIIMIKSNNLFWAFISGYVIGSGAGDYLMVIEALKCPEGVKFKEHPKQAGLYILLEG